MSNRKKVSEIAEAPVASLMKMALEPKKIDAMNRIGWLLEDKIVSHLRPNQFR